MKRDGKQESPPEIQPEASSRLPDRITPHGLRNNALLRCKYNRERGAFLAADLLYAEPPTASTH